jgi:hypothetical protein
MILDHLEGLSRFVPNVHLFKIIQVIKSMVDCIPKVFKSNRSLDRFCSPLLDAWRLLRRLFMNSLSTFESKLSIRILQEIFLAEIQAEGHPLLRFILEFQTNPWFWAVSSFQLKCMANGS